MEMARQSVEEKLESAEEEIIELSVALAKKVWQQKSDDKEAFLLLVKQVVAEVKDYDDISIYVTLNIMRRFISIWTKFSSCYTKNAD